MPAHLFEELGAGKGEIITAAAKELYLVDGLQHFLILPGDVVEVDEILQHGQFVVGLGQYILSHLCRLLIIGLHIVGVEQSGEHIRIVGGKVDSRLHGLLHHTIIVEISVEARQIIVDFRCSRIEPAAEFKQIKGRVLLSPLHHRYGLWKEIGISQAVAVAHVPFLGHVNREADIVQLPISACLAAFSQASVCIVVCICGRVYGFGFHSVVVHHGRIDFHRYILQVHLRRQHDGEQRHEKHQTNPQHLCFHILPYQKKYHFTPVWP